MLMTSAGRRAGRRRRLAKAGLMDAWCSRGHYEFNLGSVKAQHSARPVARRGLGCPAEWRP